MCRGGGGGGSGAGVGGVLEHVVNIIQSLVEYGGIPEALQ